MKKITILLLILLPFIIGACRPDVPSTPDGVVVGKGVYVLSEGTFTYANASLSFYDPEADTVANRLFYRANGSPIGDVAQSLALIGNDLYIVVNNSKYIYKVNASSIACDTTKPFKLGDFYSPRYMLPVSPDKVYVSDLMGKDLWIINPQDMSHTGTIAMGKPTETMVQVGSEVYVANWSNYYANDVEKNTVQVVDMNADLKVAEIQVGKEPNGMVVDKNGQVWVLCEGAAWDEDAEDPTLWRINPMSKKAECMLTLQGTAVNLAVDPSGTYLYYFLDGDVRRTNINNPTAEDAFCIPSEGRTLYKIAVNPNNGELYVTDAKNYMQNGTVYRYSSDGVLLSSFNAGICPSFMLFN